MKLITAAILVLEGQKMMFHCSLRTPAIIYDSKSCHISYHTRVESWASWFWCMTVYSKTRECTVCSNYSKQSCLHLTWPVLLYAFTFALHDFVGSIRNLTTWSVTATLNFTPSISASSDYTTTITASLFF